MEPWMSGPFDSPVMGPRSSQLDWERFKGRRGFFQSDKGLPRPAESGATAPFCPTIPSDFGLRKVFYGIE